MTTCGFLAGSAMYFLRALSNLPFLERKETVEIEGASLFPLECPPKFPLNV